MSSPVHGPILRICFVCTGNICRSPMAEVIFRQLVADAGFADDFVIASAGTGEWHVGEHADPRTRAALQRAGYEGAPRRARQFELAWFEEFDLLITFDRGQRRILRSWAPTPDDRVLIRPLLTFVDEGSPNAEVLDPYYGTEELFDLVRDQIEAACRALLLQMIPVVQAAKSGRRSISRPTVDAHEE